MYNLSQHVTQSVSELLVSRDMQLPVIRDVIPVVVRHATQSNRVCVARARDN